MVLLLVVLAGCSSTRMAYRYADWGIVWWVEDYVTLSSPQLNNLQQGIDDILQWHCSVELPRYSQWLADLESTVEADALDRKTVARYQAGLIRSLDRLLIAVTPIATELLASLNDDQITELEQSMAEDRREKEEKYLAPDSQERRLARAERVRERSERWLGELNSRQRQLIVRWSRGRDEQIRIWLESRERWQEALLDALENRDQAGFSARIETLLQNYGEVMGKDYLAMASDSREAVTDLALALLDAADKGQRRQLTGQLTDLRRDFEALSCR
jgi:hypothetical protein